ncbi:HlyD family efflux transporter periplasmic adaptor subunit [Shewanella sp. Scap07]|uniref:efflux RND transporter periplasmic adaptor subunit n=1 Tax=Shewanella sp. Scap07 TaxID=2589987 RepID=UPI0015B89F84|nr:efflux RND transporter periplasmic adaptor subunit [Shewanella sp. Scap07]QLE85290.1 HlyD family efflux transporter periplasmic adaptor subunit [Shewanella sp. Scap07]
MFCNRLTTSLAVLVGSMALSGCNGHAVTEVEQGVLAQQIEVTGELVSADTVSMMPPAMRRVWQYQVKYLAPEGSEVKQGDVVARLDTSEVSQRLSVRSAKLAATQQDIETSKLRNAKKLEELRLDLAEAKMNFEKAQRKFDLSDDTVAAIEKQKYQRDAEIAADKVLLTEQQIDLEIKSAKQRQAMLSGDEQKFAAEVANLQRGIASLTLKAPRAGMVVYGNDSQGNKIKEGQSVYVGDAVLSIPDLSHMQVNMTVPEVEARRVKLGQQIKIRLDANPERVFNGEIVELGAVFRHKNQDIPLVVFDAVASIAKPDTDLMRPGMTAKIAINTANDDQVNLLSIEAVHYDDGRPYVYTAGKLWGQAKQLVTLGDVGIDKVAITEGVTVGDEVILP